MAKASNETGAGSETTGSSSTPSASTGGKKFYAHRRILHENTVIFPGQELPAKFPEDSRKLLEKDGTVCDFPPPKKEEKK